MRLLSIQSIEKLNCLDNVIPNYGEYWTSGTNDGCKNNRYRWCSHEFKDFVKPDVNLNTTYTGNSQNATYCVKARNTFEGVKLSVTDCYETLLQPICETRVMAESHVQEVFNECKLTHRVSQREVEKFNTSEIDRFSFKMKCLMTCMAELLGFVKTINL
ncbi:uncharacterized protein LOC135937670 [Cloeon dipterum]|uniref:uncharacterized protein LOC135937670 n=1 Tax=Cloeon dipterum TaxID=197152 RepID=UPI0032200387